MDEGGLAAAARAEDRDTGVRPDPVRERLGLRAASEEERRVLGTKALETAIWPDERAERRIVGLLLPLEQRLLEQFPRLALLVLGGRRQGDVAGAAPRSALEEEHLL